MKGGTSNYLLEPEVFQAGNKNPCLEIQGSGFRVQGSGIHGSRKGAFWQDAHYRV